MKKMLSLILAIVMMFALAVSASAAGSATLSSGVTGDTEKDVTINVAGGASADNTYAVTITWSAEPTFTYTYPQKVWDEVNHVEVQNDGSWNESNVTITIENDSNVGITYTATYDDTDYDDNGTASVTLGNANNTLNSAHGGTKSETITVEPTGKPTNFTTTTIGEITIAISPELS